MSNFLAWLFKTFVLDYVLGKIGNAIKDLFNWWRERKKRKEIKQRNDAQAAIVEKISQEIIALEKANQPVPIELIQRLRDESAKLVDLGRVPVQ